MNDRKTSVNMTMPGITILSASLLVPLASLAGEGGVSPKAMADAVHAVIQADRTVYSRDVVNRLQLEEKLIEVSEHWKDEKALPLPSQMLRMGAELVAEEDTGLSYALLSLWPINSKNGPRTEAETTGLKQVVDHPGENYYAEEQLGGARYFTAVYPDKAVAESCVSCHNDHKDTPKRDFKLGDVMGGVVVRFPLEP